jgi:hypothetical protein
MRISIAIAGIFLAALAGRTAAAEVPAASRVDAVTVFLSGAEVTRTAQLNLDKGEHTIVFDDLPAEAVPGSIRVDGKATAKLDIESVDTRRRYIARADQATVQAERKSIEDEIEKLRDERGLAQGQQDAAQTQKTLLTNLAELPGRSEEQKVQPVPQTDWTQILGLIATGMTAAQRSALEAEVKKRELDRKIEDLEKKLSAMAPPASEPRSFSAPPPPRGGTSPKLSSTPPGCCATTPAHSVKTALPRLDPTPRRDRQRTGERPRRFAAINRGCGQQRRRSTDGDGRLRFRPPRSRAPAADGPSPSRSRSAADMKVGEEMKAAAAAAPEPAVDIGEQNAAVAAAPFQAVFTVPNRLTVPATGEAKRVLLQQDAVEPVLTVRSVPKVDSKAYLYAKLVLPKGSPLLPGTVSLFRDGTFVGIGDLPVLSPGEEHELGFGADDQVRVRHAIADEKRGETGLISSARTDSRNFRITVKNMHERAVQLVVHDQIPAREPGHQGRADGTHGADASRPRRQARRRRLGDQARA